jgi:hypothetical protein
LTPVIRRRHLTIDEVRRSTLVRRTGEPFSTHHRIIDTAGEEHDVVVGADVTCWPV